MCGIAGAIGVAPNRIRPAMGKMLASLRHRGPDFEGTAFLAGPQGTPDAALLHTRLSIIDLSPMGQQPMAESRLTLIYNGEIFNFKELRQSLIERGAHFHSQSDTEVILKAYRFWGEAAIERMRGMFAWALFDQERGAIWLCRDRLGIKPLYLSRPPTGGLLFASELRTLLAAGEDLVPRRVRRSALESFLAQGMICGTETFVEGIEQLPASTSLWVDWNGKEIRTKAYWSLPFAPDPSALTSFPKAAKGFAVEALSRTLREAVKLRLVADVPLGIFLSGGIDSGALATLATDGEQLDVRTLSIGFDIAAMDESVEAAAVASRLGTQHQCVRLSGEELLDDMQGVFGAMDQPTVDGFNTFVVSRAARAAGLKVALSGIGGDELFAGYATFRDVPSSISARRLASLAGPVRQILPYLARLSGGRRGIKISELLARQSSPLQAYLLRRELFLPKERRLLQALPPGCDPQSGLNLSMLDDLETKAKNLHPINQVSFFEMSVYLSSMLLRDADVFSMSAGIEVRVPLLDHLLVEQVAMMPGEWKRPNNQPKRLLTEAVGPRLPEIVLHPKRGFAFPWDAWLRGPMRTTAEEAITDNSSWNALEIDPSAPKELWARFLANDPRVTALQIIALWTVAEYCELHKLRVAA